MVSLCSSGRDYTGVMFQEFESMGDNNDCKDNVMDGCCWILLKTNSREQQKKARCEIQRPSLVPYKEVSTSEAGRQWKLRFCVRIYSSESQPWKKLNSNWGSAALPRSGLWLRKNGILTHRWDTWVYTPSNLEFEDSIIPPEPANWLRSSVRANPATLGASGIFDLSTQDQMQHCVQPGDPLYIKGDTGADL